MQLHRIWHEGTLGNGIKTEFYSEENAEVVDGILVVHHKAARKALSIPLARIFWMESEFVDEG